MNYKGIFFDIGWTLMRPRRSWFLSDFLYDMLPSETSEDIFAQAFESAMYILDDNHKMDTLQQEEQQFFLFYQAVFAQLPHLGLGESAAKAVAHDKVFNYRNYIFFEDALPVLTRLKRKFRLGVISDTWPSATEFLKGAGLYDLFDSITFSCQLGVFKPDPVLYNHALAGLGLPPEKTFFVDDCPECLEGAKECGILPIQILNKPGLQPAPQLLHANNLTDLEILLSQL